MINFKVIKPKDDSEDDMTVTFKEKIGYASSYWHLLEMKHSSNEHNYVVKKLMVKMLKSWKSILESNLDLHNKLLVFDQSDQHLCGFHFSKDKITYSIYLEDWSIMYDTYYIEIDDSSLITDFVLDGYNKKAFLRDIDVNIQHLNQEE
jgi:hypothetical protein